MQAPTYRLSLIGRTGAAANQRINLGKARDDGPEKTYSASEVENLIPELRRRNARGFDIYITPIDPVHHYIIIDDMKPSASKLLEDLGFAPTLVQASSKDNEQAVIKVARIDRKDEQPLANRLVQELNSQHGDPKFSGVIHPFRMAGFSNRKPGRANVFTRILQASHRLCARATVLLQQLRDAADSLLAQRRRQAELAQVETDAKRQTQHSQARSDRTAGPPIHDDDAEAAFRRLATVVRSRAAARGWPEDLSRVDFQVARWMLNDGWTEAEVRAGMLASSESLAQRHANTDKYVDSTVLNAGNALAADKQASRASMPPGRSAGPRK